MARTFTTGFEFSSPIDNGILLLPNEVSVTGIQPRRSAGSNGGSRSLDANTTTTNLTTFQPFEYELPESWIRIYFRIDSAPSTHEYIFYDANGGSEIFKLSFQNSNGPLVLNVNGSDVDTGTKLYAIGTYYSMQIAADISGSGTITVDIDGLNDITYNGTTNGGGTGWNQLRLNTDGRVFYDDFAINDSYIRINYDGGNGDVPTTSLTGSGPGTATILKHVGDGTTGYLIANVTSGSFSDNDTLTDTGTFTGVVNGDQDSSNTSAPNEGFVQLFYPNGVGSTTQLTNSDETQVDNFSYVNSFENRSTFVFDDVGGNKDTYAMQDIPAEAIGINHVDAYFFAQRDGNSVSNIRAVLRTNSTDYESYQEFLPGSARWVGFSYQENPDTQSPWLIADLNSIESGSKLEV